jgi:hypothetical protein
MALAASREGAFRDAEMADRWVYVFMGGLFLVTAVTGFYPTSTGLLDAVDAGTRPPPPLRLHIHAFLMVSWITIFFLQALLIAVGRRRYHIQFGLISLILIPSIVIATIAVILGVWERIAEVLPSLDETTRNEVIYRGSNVLLSQIQTLVLLIIFYVWAFLYRRKHSETHKRIMTMAVLVVLSAAVGRLLKIGVTLPETPGLYLACTIGLITPALIWDVVRRGRVHKAYMAAIATYAVVSIPMYVLWGSDWWLATAPPLMGVD